MRQLRISKQVTKRETLSLEKYLQEISKVELLTAEEEVELARRIKKGDKKALERLIKANLRFVISVAKQYQNQGLSLPDLINEGNLGLIKAAQRFDETKGFKFISYAVWWIRQTILQSLAEQARIVRLPLNKIGAINKLSKALTTLEQEFEREPTIDEISKLMELAPENIKEMLKNSGKHISLDAPVNDENDSDMYDILASNESVSPDSSLLDDSLKQEINRALSALPYREAAILRMYFGLDSKNPFSLEEIGEEFNLTRERVRQIKDNALNKLKNTTKNKVLKTYLGA